MGTIAMRNQGLVYEIKSMIAIELKMHRKKSETMSGSAWSTVF